jgi:hypothetical protein
MANLFYNRVAGFIRRTTAKSIDVKNELDAISAGFDLLPTPRNDGRGFIEAVKVGPAIDSDQAITLGQLSSSEIALSELLDSTRLSLQDQMTNTELSVQQNTLSAESAATRAEGSASRAAQFDPSSYYQKSIVDLALSLKQAVLTSGLTIKTVGGVSLLGAGDIQVSSDIDCGGASAESNSFLDLGSAGAL